MTMIPKTIFYDSSYYLINTFIYTILSDMKDKILFFERAMKGDG
jgi:hypothetical protein